MRSITLIILLIIANIACSKEESRNISSKQSQNSLSNNAIEMGNSIVIPEKNENSLDRVEDKEDKTISVKDSIGLVVLSDKYPSSDEIKEKDDFVRFYNEDGSLWYEFTFYYDDSDGKFEYENDDFRPLSFHPDHFLLVLRCIDEDKDRYKVIVNENKEITKFVKKSGSLKWLCCINS